MDELLQILFDIVVMRGHAHDHWQVAGFGVETGAGGFGGINCDALSTQRRDRFPRIQSVMSMAEQKGTTSAV